MTQLMENILENSVRDEKPNHRDKGKRYASIKNPLIEAMVSSMYRIDNKERVLHMVTRLADKYIVSKKQPKDTKRHAVILWIKGYELTEEEVKKGYLGNYAYVSFKKLRNDQYTIYGKKIESELRHHPQRKRPKQKHPNWGHPILRSVIKKRMYRSIEEAQNELQLLHNEYPEVSIPCPNKLYVIIYQKKENNRSPIQKFILEIKVARKGGFYIDYRENDYQRSDTSAANNLIKRITSNATPLASVTNSDGEDKQAQNMGYFTSQVILKRSRKRKTNDVMAEKKAALEAKKQADTKSTNDSDTASESDKKSASA